MSKTLSKAALSLALLVQATLGLVACGTDTPCSSDDCTALDAGHDDADLIGTPTDGAIDDKKDKIVLTGIEGNGSWRPIAYGSDKPIAAAKEARRRFRGSWLLTGKNLDRLTGIKLVGKDDPSKIEWADFAPKQGDKHMRLIRLPGTLAAGMFFIVGMVGIERVALGEVFVLQGERGPSGADYDTSVATFVSTLKRYLIVDAAQNLVTFYGANVQVVNGSGHSTSDNGKGNLIIGYNENDKGRSRTGSHNLVVGMNHGWTSSGGFVAGLNNVISGFAATICGGEESTASGRAATVAGGIGNSAEGWAAAVSGGYSNTARGETSVVGGGAKNTASGDHSAVAAGLEGTASGNYSAVSGGQLNIASGWVSTVMGGFKQQASTSGSYKP
ncbi:MAG: hypothetical protein H6707_03915 [Deltaproteobacteria bacterium]|nr:hypothetical protein [Deltaproteobacteria bacterium]